MSDSQLNKDIEWLHSIVYNYLQHAPTDIDLLEAKRLLDLARKAQLPRAFEFAKEAMQSYYDHQPHYKRQARLMKMKRIADQIVHDIPNYKETTTLRHFVENVQEAYDFINDSDAFQTFFELADESYYGLPDEYQTISIVNKPQKGGATNSASGVLLLGAAALLLSKFIQ